MKNYFVCLFLALFLNENYHSQPSLQLGLIDKEFLHRLDGMIDDFEIEFYYRISNNTISGYYHYIEFFERINILGYVKKDSIIIFEFDNEGNKTGIFSGTVKNRLLYSGNWLHIKTKKNRKFELHSKYQAFNNDLTGQIYFKSEQSIYFYNLEDSLGMSPTDFSLLNYTRYKERHYFLFRNGAASRPPSSRAGYCGSGYEENISLMCIDANFKLDRFDSYLINSCFGIIQVKRI